jgi:L-lactate dehydrogenase complex protein LldE
MDVAVFITCLTDTFFPRVGLAAARLLRHFGCRVHFPAAQTCCGQPAYNSGFHDEAACLVRRMADVFAGYAHVVTPSASCATLVQRHGPELLRGDPAAHALADKTHEILTFLRDRLHVDLAATLRFDEPVTFHYSCHARETYSPTELQGWLTGRHADWLRVPRRADLCCGFGGLFAVEFPELSGAMLDDKLDELVATGAELVICNEAACALQLMGGARRRGLRLRFKHLVECLAESLGLLEPAA